MTAKIAPEIRIEQINASGEILFLHWDGDYVGSYSKAVCLCLTHQIEWSVSVNDLVNGRRGCPSCKKDKLRISKSIPQNEYVDRLKSICDICFVGWSSSFKGVKTKAVCKCVKCGSNWEASIDNIMRGRRCSHCSKTGYKTSLKGTLYALRSECGTMVKIGISNDHKRRHSELVRATPFSFECVELCHGDGSLIAILEKVLHDLMTPVKFDHQFDGSTEWREWDDRLPVWFEMYRGWS